MKQLLPYKLPTIVRAKRGWFVVYHYEMPGRIGEYKRFEVKDGVNYVKDLEQKEKEIQRLRDDIEYSLKNGFNPFLADGKVFAEEIEAKTQIAVEKESEVVEGWSLVDMLDKFIKHCEWKGLAHNSIRKYRSYNNGLLKWLELSDNLEMKACDFTEEDAFEFLNDMSDTAQWNARTYNNYASHLPTLFKGMEKIERRENSKLIKYVADLSELEKKKTRAERNRYYSPMVAVKVKEELLNYPELYNYVSWIYYSCMRPREIRLLQVQHIDLSARQIKVIGPTAKTGDRFVPICDELHALVKKMGLEKANLGDYVFGKGGPTGPSLSNPDHFREIYRDVKIKLNLDVKYSLYSWKHTRVVELLRAGFTDYQVMELTGHDDYKAFEAYKRDLIIDTDVMKGKTIDF